MSKRISAAVVLAFAALAGVAAFAQSGPRRWPVPRPSQRQALVAILQREGDLQRQHQALEQDYRAVIAEIASDLAIPPTAMLKVADGGGELIEVAASTTGGR